MHEQPPQRRIRSFVRRQGRLTTSQQQALESLWPHYGLDPEAGMLNPDTLVPAQGKLTLEIGFGNGAGLAQMADADRASSFIGIEVHRPGVGHLLLEIQQRKLDNVRIYCADAIDVLRHCIPAHSLDRVCLFFPDPWHKKRHHKRRIVNQDFLELITSRLVPGGIFHAATDWEDYAWQMLQTLDGFAGLHNSQPTGGFTPRPGWRPLTRFEQRGQRLGHGVWDLIYMAESSAASSS